MNTDVFATWLERRGLKVFSGADALWHQQARGVVQAFPYYRTICPEPDEVKAVLLKHSFIAARYSSPIEATEGAVSYHVVFDAEEYLLEALSKKARYDVKKALSRFAVEKISFSRLAREGWPARRETLIRQGRTKSEDESWWRCLCDATEDLLGFEAWGALLDGCLVASIIAFLDETCASVLFQQSCTDQLAHGVNNALAYVCTNSFVTRPNITSVYYGMESLDAPPSVDSFKIRMRYRAKPVRQCVVVHPLAAPIFSGPSHWFSRRLFEVTRLPAAAKIQGLIGLYRRGLNDPEDQPIPELLKEDFYRFRDSTEAQ